MWTARASLVIVVSLLGIGAAVMCLDAPVAAAASGPQDAIHQVMPGDDLHLVAGYYYGDARQWERIWQANRDEVSNPNRIERGSLLRIPDATAPAETYADFVARARRARPEVAGPVKAEAPPAPEVEVRIAGETPPASPGPPAEPTARTTPPGPAELSGRGGAPPVPPRPPAQSPLPAPRP